jgi:hypothetical protein
MRYCGATFYFAGRRSFAPGGARSITSKPCCGQNVGLSWEGAGTPANAGLRRSGWSGGGRRDRAPRGQPRPKSTCGPRLKTWGAGARIRTAAYGAPNLSIIRRSRVFPFLA